jgi:hypothetical protein
MGYGPKTDFIVSGDMTNPSIRETGLLIASQDLSHTKDEGKTKKFRTFESIRKEMRTSLRAEGLEGDQLDRTLQDKILPALDSTNIKKIDLLSRIFLLSDVMVNQGNFGSVEREKKVEKPFQASGKYWILQSQNLGCTLHLSNICKIALRATSER